MRQEWRTDLPVAECLARLGASGWSGEPRPDRWRPTAADRDLFRLLRGQTFQLMPRELRLGTLNSLGPFAPRVVGTVEEAGAGSRIVTEHTTVLGRPLLIVAAIFLVLTLIAVPANGLTPATPGEFVRVILNGFFGYCVSVGALILLARQRWLIQEEATRAATARFLTETLEARSLGRAVEGS